tara:strand:- start:443 stop:673 length:231 start_codon:yes stop_codon:yes gene_type:complete
LTGSAESAYKQLTKEIAMSEKTGRTRLKATRIKTGFLTYELVYIHQTEISYFINNWDIVDTATKWINTEPTCPTDV